MESPIPPDPYAALGVSSNAQPNEIKTAYRKLVLRCHPDKITDETLKQKAVDEFHKVQQAYEIIGDEEKRGRYDALVRLAELRRQKMEMNMSASHGSVRTASYDTRTAAPPASFASRGPPSRSFTTNERRPSHYSDEDLPRASARKTPNEFNFGRRDTFERERTKERDTDRVRRDEERRRSERRRDNEREADRSSKYAPASRDEEFARTEELRRRRDSDEKEQSRRLKETLDERAPKDYENAQKYMAQHRPDYSRSTSSAHVPSYTYVRRSAADARERRSGREASPRDSRRAPEIVDPSRPSTLKSQYSDPAGVAGAVPRSRDKPEAHRAYTTSDFDRRRDASEPMPFFSRSATMPMPPSSSTPRKSAPSNLRTTDIPDSGYSSPATPEREFAPPPPGPPPSSSKTTQYRYPDTSSSSKVPSGKDYRTIYRQPTGSSSSARRVSPPAKERSSNSSAKTANMMANLANSRTMPVRSATFTAEPTSSRASPRLSRSPERISSRDDRDRGRRDRYREEPSRGGKLYGEVGAGRDPRSSRASYVPEETSYTRQFSRDDVRYSSGPSRSGDYDRAPPSLSRRGTAVY